MSTPAIQLVPWAQGPEPTTILPGSGLAADMLVLIPSSEPGTVGLPPLTPDLVSSWGVAGTTRRVRDAAGYTQTTPLDTTQRTAWQVAWTGLSLAERNTLLAWLRTDAEYGLFAFTLEPDGPGEGSVNVRPLVLYRDVHIGPRHYDVLVECEEVFV